MKTRVPFAGLQYSGLDSPIWPTVLSWSRLSRRNWSSEPCSSSKGSRRRRPCLNRLCRRTDPRRNRACGNNAEPRLKRRGTSEKCNQGLSFGALFCRVGRSRTSVAIMFSRSKHHCPRQERLHSLDCETTLFINQRRHSSRHTHICQIEALLRILTYHDPFSEAGYIRFSAP